MAISIDWGTRVIFVPRLDMPLAQASPERRELDLSAFRLELKALEASEGGQPHPDTHVHATTVVLSGVTYARSIEIVNGYTVTFEPGLYGVIGVGANSNVLDVYNDNGVHYLGNNSAGLIETGESGLTPTESLTLELVKKLLANRTETDPVAGTYTVYDDDDVSPLLQGNLWEDIAASQSYQGQGADRRDRLT